MEPTPKKKSYNDLEVASIILSASEIISYEDYVERAIRTNKVTVLTSYDTVYTDCPIMNGYNKDYKIPLKVGELGTQVLISKVLGSMIPIIVGIIPMTEFDDNIKLLNQYESNDIYESDECIINYNGYITSASGSGLLC